MRLVSLLILLFPLSVMAEVLVIPNSAVVPNDKPYYLHKAPNSEIIYTQDNKDVAEYTLGFEKKLIPLYDSVFGYTLDSRLSVGLISSHNQIANGFSTQYPNNRQINYMGGAQSIDYFSSPSWLDTLLLHETAHNYQTNAKASAITRGLHTTVRNGFFLFPIFSTPNAFESSFILEGNAVLNESWHGKGGRLYSGRYRAMYHAHSQAGYLSKSRMYNNTLNFPYGEGHYIFGGFYQAFLAEKYNLNKVNNYFWQRSKTWYYPFTVNTPTLRTFGWSFDALFAEWKSLSETISANFTMVQGDILARSKFYSEISRHQDRLLFISNPTGTTHPSLHEYNTQTSGIDSKETHLNAGRVFDVDGQYYSVSSRHTSVDRITQGLFDEEGELLEGTSGKVIQGYLNNGSPVYFRSTESYQSPKLYIDETFYDEVHSSVLVKDNSLYYFKQDGAQRTLYKDKQALVAFPGYYSIVSDVDQQGRIYFIANSELGSSLYRYGKNGIEKVIQADNVLSAKLIDTNKVMVTAVSADDYYFSITEMNPQPKSPFIVRYFWDDSVQPQSQNLAEVDAVEIKKDTPYNFSNSIRYAAGSLFTTKDEDDNTLFSAALTFSDPLTYHNLSIFADRDSDLTSRLGVSYSNNQHQLMYGFKTYGVVENGLEELEKANPFFETRSYGVGIDLQLPLFKQGFWNVDARSSYFQDYKNIEREPISVSLSANNVHAFGMSMFVNEGMTTSLYTVNDRDQNIFGGKLAVYTSGPWQTYANAKTQYSYFDGALNGFYGEGIVLSKQLDFFGNDPSGFVMPSLYRDSLASKVAKTEVNVSKVFNGSAYGFWFPVSVRRQAFNLSYRYYDIRDFVSYVPSFNAYGNFGDVQIQQTAASLEVDTLFFHKFAIRIKLEAIFNDDDRVVEKNTTNFSIAVPF